MSDKAITVPEILPILKDVTIFSGFTEDETRKICENCNVITFNCGDVLLEEGTPATEIFILLKGKISIVMSLRDDPIELSVFGPGHCIGEASVIGIQDHSASAVVIDQSVLLVLSRQILMTLFETDKGLFSLLILNIAREIARRLHHTDEILLHYGKWEKFRKEISNQKSCD